MKGHHSWRVSRIAGHRGIAVMTCVLLIGFVGAAVVAMSAHLAADLNRTRHVSGDAQLRQVLTFASVALQRRLAAGEIDMEQLTASLTPMFPDALIKKASVRVSSVKDEPDKQTLQVTAEFESRSATQILEYRKEEGGWRLHSARLAGHP